MFYDSRVNSADIVETAEVDNGKSNEESSYEDVTYGVLRSEDTVGSGD
mgnify:CR=1 FL=1